MNSNINFSQIKKMNLANFCTQKLSYKPDSKHDSKLWRVLLSRKGDKILIKNVPNKNGHFIYKNVQNDTGGTIFDLLLNEEDMSWNQISAFFKEANDLLQPTYVAQQPKQQKPPMTPEEVFAKLEKNLPCDNYFAKRNITLETCKAFNLRAAAKKTTFPIFDFYKKTEVWQAISAIEYCYGYNGRYNRFLAAKNAGCGVLIPFEKTVPKFKILQERHTVLIFESSLDALAFWQLFQKLFRPKKLVFLCTFGNPSAAFLASLPEKLHNFCAEKVYICGDNDAGGEKFNEKIHKEICTNFADIPHSIIQYNGPYWDCKDWAAALQL